MLGAVSTDKAPAAIGPYSQAVIAGKTIYASGQIPLVPETGEIASDDIEVQTRQVLENLKGVLEAAGSGLNKVVKTTVFLKMMSQFARMNEVYSKYFSSPFPARSTVEVSSLPRNVLVEIEAIAIKEE